MKKIGCFTQEVIDLLELNLKADTPIFIGDSNIEHIKSRHPYEYEKYSSEYVRVAVRITANNKCYAKTLHLLSTCNAECHPTYFIF